MIGHRLFGYPMLAAVARARVAHDSHLLWSLVRTDDARCMRLLAKAVARG